MKKTSTLFYICFLMTFTFVSQGFAQKYEAENASLSGGAAITSCSGCSGGSAVAQNAGNLSFTVNISESAHYDIYIHAASPGGNKANIIRIGDNAAAFNLEKNSQYTTHKIVSYYRFAAGQQKVQILNSWGYINIDYIELQKSEAAERFNLAQTLVTPNATPEATALFGFLLDHYNKRIISGGMTLNDLESSDWLNWIEEQTGKEVALLGLDFMHSGRGNTWYDDAAPIKDAEAWYNRNGIPAMMWHWGDPLHRSNEFYTDQTDFDVSKISDENSAEYQGMIEDIDYISGLLLQLQEKNVPLIWRPLHEAAGGWFWWGAKGPEPLKQLWRLMYDRMVNHHGLRNLIWVWTTEPGDDAWYPGDEYVDIIGRDIYIDGDHGSHTMEFNTLNDRYDGTKMIALSENGSIPDPDELLKDEAAWSWFMPWYREYTTDSYYNSAELWNKVMNHDYVITLDEMPDLKTYERQEVSEPERPAEPEPEPTAVRDTKASFKAFPTWVDESITIESDKRIETVALLNSMGVLVKNVKVGAYTAELSLAGLRPGVYLLRVNGGETIKVLKK